MNNRKTWTVQNTLFGAFTRHHKLLYIFYTAGIYFETKFVMVTCFYELFRLLFMAVCILLVAVMSMYLNSI
jgi:hypothetical protein